MSEKLVVKNIDKKKQKKLTVEKVAAVKKTAPLNEVSKKREPKKRGQPKKEEVHKVTQKVTIYLTEEQAVLLERKAVKAGYPPKDKAKWLKRTAIAPKRGLSQDAVPNEIAMLREKVKSLQAQLEMKDEMIEILKGK